jgi:hypothetical protein
VLKSHTLEKTKTQFEMKTIELLRTQPNEIEQLLKETFENETEGTLIFLENEGERFEGILVPNTDRFKALFKELRVNGVAKMELKWGDRELSVQLGMCLIQHALSGQKMVFRHASSIIFSLVDEGFYLKYL